MSLLTQHILHCITDESMTGCCLEFILLTMYSTSLPATQPLSVADFAYLAMPVVFKSIRLGRQYRLRVLFHIS